MRINLFIFLILITGKLFGQSSEEYYKLAIDYRLSGKSQESILAYTNAIKLDPSQGKYFLGRALVYMDLRNYSSAIKDLTEGINKGLKYSKDYSVACFNRGKCKAELEDYEGAILDYNLAIEKNESGDYFLGSIYLFRGDSRIALLYYDDACKDYYLAKKLGRPEADLVIEMYCNY